MQFEKLKNFISVEMRMSQVYQPVMLMELLMNDGQASVKHVHLIARRKGDVENPRGGVRHIIAGKGFYEDK